MSAGDAISSIGSSITSPAKLAFVGYVLLLYKGIITTSKWEILAIAAVFFLTQIIHDDYLRIRLNFWGERN